MACVHLSPILSALLLWLLSIPEAASQEGFPPCTLLTPRVQTNVSAQQQYNFIDLGSENALDINDLGVVLVEGYRAYLWSPPYAEDTKVYIDSINPGLSEVFRPAFINNNNDMVGWMKSDTLDAGVYIGGSPFSFRHPNDTFNVSSTTTLGKLNDKRQVVGSYRCGGWSHECSFLLNLTSMEVTDFGPNGGRDFSLSGINNDGTMWGSLHCNVEGETRSFVDRAGELSSLYWLSFDENVEVACISNNGFIAAYVNGKNSTYPGRVLLNDSSGYIFPSGEFPISINSQGVIIGWKFIATPVGLIFPPMPPPPPPVIKELPLCYGQTITAEIIGTAQTEYTFRVLPLHGIVFGLNDHGVILTDSRYGASVLWSPPYDIHSMVSVESIMPGALNNNNDLVGIDILNGAAAYIDGKTIPFRHPNDTIWDSSTTWFTGINDLRQAVGTYLCPPQDYCSFVVDLNTMAVRDIGPNGGCGFSVVGINNNGDTCGWVHCSDDKGRPFVQHNGEFIYDIEISFNGTQYSPSFDGISNMFTLVGSGDLNVVLMDGLRRGYVFPKDWLPLRINAAGSIAGCLGEYCNEVFIATPKSLTPPPQPPHPPTLKPPPRKPPPRRPPPRKPPPRKPPPRKPPPRKSPPQKPPPQKPPPRKSPPSKPPTTKPPPMKPPPLKSPPLRPSPLKPPLPKLSPLKPPSTKAPPLTTARPTSTLPPPQKLPPMPPPKQ